MQGKGFELHVNGKKACVTPVKSKIGQVYKETIYFIFLRGKGWETKNKLNSFLSVI